MLKQGLSYYHARQGGDFRPLTELPYWIRASGWEGSGIYGVP